MLLLLLLLPSTVAARWVSARAGSSTDLPCTAVISSWLLSPHQLCNEKGEREGGLYGNTSACTSEIGLWFCSAQGHVRYFGHRCCSVLGGAF